MGLLFSSLELSGCARSVPGNSYSVTALTPIGGARSAPPLLAELATVAVVDVAVDVDQSIRGECPT